jgi:hypothetical protein
MAAQVAQKISEQIEVRRGRSKKPRHHEKQNIIPQSGHPDGLSMACGSSGGSVDPRRPGRHLEQGLPFSAR